MTNEDTIPSLPYVAKEFHSEVVSFDRDMMSKAVRLF